MANKTSKFCRNAVKKTADALYTTGRKVGAPVYLGLPALGLGAADVTRDAIDSIPWYNPAGWVIGIYELFGGNQIDKIEEAKNASIHGIAGATALATTKLINSGTERCFPYSHNVRNLIEAGAYATPGILAHQASKYETLDSLLSSLNSPVALATTLSETASETASETLDTATNFLTQTEITPQNLLQTAGAVFLGMATYRILNLADRLTFDIDPIRKLRDDYVEKAAEKRRKSK